MGTDGGWGAKCILMFPKPISFEVREWRALRQPGLAAKKFGLIRVSAEGYVILTNAMRISENAHSHTPPHAAEPRGRSSLRSATDDYDTKYK